MRFGGLHDKDHRILKSRYIGLALFMEITKYALNPKPLNPKPVCSPLTQAIHPLRANGLKIHCLLALAKALADQMYNLLRFLCRVWGSGFRRYFSKTGHLIELHRKT